MPAATLRAGRSAVPARAATDRGAPFTRGTRLRQDVALAERPADPSEGSTPTLVPSAGETRLADEVPDLENVFP